MKHLKQPKTQLFHKRNLAALMLAMAATHGANAQTQSDTSMFSQTQANASAESSLKVSGGARVDTNALVESLRAASNATVNTTADVAADIQADAASSAESASDSATETSNSIDVEALISGSSDNEAIVDVSDGVSVNFDAATDVIGEGEFEADTSIVQATQENAIEASSATSASAQAGAEAMTSTGSDAIVDIFSTTTESVDVNAELDATVDASAELAGQTVAEQELGSEQANDLATESATAVSTEVQGSVESSIAASSELASESSSEAAQQAEQSSQQAQGEVAAGLESTTNAVLELTRHVGC